MEAWYLAEARCWRLLLYTEFVEIEEGEEVNKVSKLKAKIKQKYAPKPLHHPTSHHEFLSGYAVAQALPGPVFSFSAYIGALSMRDYGTGGEIIGAIMSALGIFLPGTFLIFFVIRFWDSLKKYRAVRASLEGITAASSGLVVSIGSDYVSTAGEYSIKLCCNDRDFWPSYFHKNSFTVYNFRRIDFGFLTKIKNPR